MNSWTLLKAVHVLAGAFWYGGTALTVMYILPSARAIGPAAGPMMQQLLQVRKLSRALVSSGALAMLTGLGFYDRLSQHFAHPLVTTFHGWMLTLGGAAGVIAFFFGMLVQVPRAKRLEQLAASLAGPPTPEQAARIATLQAQLQGGGLIAVVLLAFTVIGMALSHPI